MNLSGLSLDAMPSFQTPVRFFVTAPVFAMLGGFLLMLSDLWVSRWHPHLIAMTHVFTLGFVLMVMCGALTQILPVLSGKGFPLVDSTAKIFHGLLTAGLLVFPFNFLIPSKLLVLLTSCLIAVPLLLMVFLIVKVFLSTRSNVSIFSIKLAGFCLIFTLLSGLWQLGSYHWLEASAVGKVLTNVHLIFGLLGWVLLTVMGVSFQVIPMFHVTPEFPALIKRRLPVLHFVVLLLLAGGLINQDAVSTWLAFVGLHVSLIGYSCSALWLFTQRRRKVPDATVNFWRLGLVCLLMAVGVFDVSLFVDETLQEPLQMMVALCVLFGVIIAIIFGMLLKIVPFLAFLHVQQLSMKSMATMSLMPSMAEFLESGRGHQLFYGFCVLLPMVLLAPFEPRLSLLAGGMVLIVAAYLLLLMATVWIRYKKKEADLLSIQEQSQLE